MIALICLAVALAASETPIPVHAPADGVVSPREILQTPDDAVGRGESRLMRGVVTFVSAIDGRFVVAPQDNPRHAGVVVFPDEGVARPANDDIVSVSGKLKRHGSLPEMEARRADVIRKTMLPVAVG